MLDDLLPPSNVEAEEAVIGGIILDSNAFVRVMDVLKPEAFTMTAYQLLYRSFIELWALGKSMDMTTVVSHLKDTNRLEKVGGQVAIAKLLDRVITAANIDKHAELLRDKWVRRQFIDAARQIQRMAHDCAKRPDELQGDIQGLLSAIAQNTQGREKLTSFEDIATERFEQYHDLMAAPDSVGKVATGFYDIDAMLGRGFNAGDLIILAARPSMGKSSMAINIAENVSKDGDVAYFSLEMTKESLFDRCAASKSGVNASNLRTGRLTQHDITQLSHAMIPLTNTRIWVNDDPKITVDRIYAESMQLQAVTKELKLIIVDHLGLMAREDNARIQLGRITQELRAIGKTLKVPVVALHQLSRGVESRTDKRPMQSDLREAGTIEEDADVIIMLYRDEYYDPDTCDRGIAEVLFRKQRNGPVGTVKLLFEPEFTRFRNLAGESAPVSDSTAGYVRYVPEPEIIDELEDEVQWIAR